MGRNLGVGVIAFSAIVVAGGAMAMPPSKCAKPAELTAIQAAAIQQELMVAALTCNEVTNFNAFQTGYSPELRASDATLERMFRRLFRRQPGRSRISRVQDPAGEQFLDAQHQGQSRLLSRSEPCFRGGPWPQKPTLAALSPVFRSPIPARSIPARSRWRWASSAPRSHPMSCRSPTP